MKVKLKAVVQRTVLDTIFVKVDAPNVDTAKAIAAEALKYYPKAHELPEVGYIYVENRDSLDTQVVSIEEDLPRDKRA